MSPKYMIVACAALMGLSACQFKDMSASTCAAEVVTPYIGQHKEVLSAITLPSPVRMLPPGTPMTQDFRPSRTNIELDASGRIVRAWCG